MHYEKSVKSTLEEVLVTTGDYVCIGMEAVFTLSFEIFKAQPLPILCHWVLPI